MTLHKFLSSTLKDSSFLLWAYNSAYRLKNKKKFFFELERRSHLTIFDYEELAQPMPFYPIEKIRDSNYYGHADALKKYCNCDRVSSGIEHGIYLGNRVTDAERLSTTKSVIAMSVNRVDSFKANNVNKPVLSIGPYIHYATPSLNKFEMDQLKDRLGSVLLVFPFHSMLRIHHSYDCQQFISKIEQYRQGYDTVMVCLHHNDIVFNPHYTKAYEKMGYRIVCAGHKFDLTFLRRLKVIIGLADLAITNGIGTQVGYCDYMGVPQIIINDDDSFSITFDKKFGAYNSPDMMSLADRQTHEIVEAFSEEYLGMQTKQKKAVIEKYWSPSQIKTPEELCEQIQKLNML